MQKAIFLREYFFLPPRRIFPNSIFLFFFRHRTGFVLTRTDTASNVNRFGQSVCKLDTSTLRKERRASGNSTFAIGGVSCFADTFVQAESSVLRIKFCGKSPGLLLAANRQTV